MEEYQASTRSRIKLILPALDAVRAGEDLKCGVYNGDPNPIQIGENQELWQDWNGTAVPIYPIGDVQLIRWNIDPGKSHDFTVRLPTPLVAGRYTVVHRVKRRSTAACVTSDLIELRASFELSAVTDD